MEWNRKNLLDLPRKNAFPLNVCTVYYCYNARFPFRNEYHRLNCYEISLRYSAGESHCHDYIDGKAVNVPYPHAFFKTPDMQIALAGDEPRDTISFSYPSETAPLLRQWGLLPENKFVLFNMAGIIPTLIDRFYRLCTNGISEKNISQLDSLCYQIMQEIIFNPPEDEELSNASARIRQAARYMQHHCDRPLSVGSIARKFGFSRAAFYREWSQNFDIAPKDHLLHSRLEAAALRLIYSKLPVADIAREVHFSGATAFYRKFRERYNFSPAELRNNPELWKNFVPDLIPVERPEA